MLLLCSAAATGIQATPHHATTIAVASFPLFFPELPSFEG